MLGDEHFKLRLVRLQSSAPWISESRNEDEFSFIFIKGGIGKYISPHTTQRLMPGNIVVFSGHHNGKFYADEKNECAFVSFSLLLEHLFPLFASSEISLLHNLKANFKTPKIYTAGNSMAVECQKLLEIAQAQTGLQQRSQLLGVVALILSDEFKNIHVQHSGRDWAEDHMIQVFEKLSSAELLNLSVDELAAKFNCSRRHLNRLFHQHFGLSITSLRMEIRLLKAISLLRNPREKVINVAEQCGFNHLGLFNTCFKRRYGTSPGQWYKLMAKAENPKALKNEGKPICPLQANGLCPSSMIGVGAREPAKAQPPSRSPGAAGSATMLHVASVGIAHSHSISTRKQTGP
ncbi:MAG TPA: helix-turn-helix transcriptional regulator [Verrucomicrobiae bacterium]|jgi:AraC-like DNA-binding protein